MRVSSVNVVNFRAFESSGDLPLGQLTVLIGPNNAGKSSLIRSLLLLQANNGSSDRDIRLGTAGAEIRLTISGLSGVGVPPGWLQSEDIGTLAVGLRAHNGPQLSVIDGKGQARSVQLAPSTEPNHYIVPFLGARRTQTYGESVTQHNTEAVDSSLELLAARLSRLANPSFAASATYREACHEILGVVVTAVPSANGQMPGIYLPDQSTIYIRQMGDGVPHVVGLLVDLSLYRGKLFLIEELENDLHPTALKALLRLIVTSAEHNQFVVSTHSNIVASYLASTSDSRLYYVDSTPGSVVPTARVREVGPDASDRTAVLRELGYELIDMELWDAWLFLEESSAERVIREFLIPWFVPGLDGRIRTVAAGGISKVGPTFEDFHRLMLFAHLQAGYRQRAWVVVDGGEAGAKIISELSSRYSATWDLSHFRSLREVAFERYYPSRFQNDADTALSMKDREQRRESKAP